TNLAAIVGEALLDSGQKDKALPILQRALEATPDSVRVKDALAAVSYDPEFWADEVERLTDEAERFDEATSVRMLVRAARILRIEAPEDARLEELLKRILAKDIDEPSTNFLYETLLSTTNRWDELEAHHKRRAERTGDHGKKIEVLRTFGLEWIQRFKDRDRGARFFDAALRATASNGAVPMRSVVAAFTLLRQVQGERGEWSQLLDIAESLLDRPSGISGEDNLYIAIQAGQIALEKCDDLPRARRFFATAAGIEPQHPTVQEFVNSVGLGGQAAMAAGSRPAVTPPPPAPVAPVVPAGPAVDGTPVAGTPVAAAPAAAPVAPVADQKPAAPTRSGKTVPPPMPQDLDGAMSVARASEAGGDRGVHTWKEVISRHPKAREPRRELARVLRNAQSWAQLADALKDEEAKTADAGVDKANVLLELAEVYGKLNNDNQVMTALSSALQQDPSRLEIYDRLCALYEAKKRWPDLVKVLLEKAERVPLEDGEDAEQGQGKIAIYLQVANLYLERFSNQAEAIKAFERVLELDPDNKQAIDDLLAVYEKRRDWEKLIKLKEAEVDRAPDGERAAKVIEVARMAASKVKKPEICTYWWEKVLQYEPTHDEALSELYKLYERNKEWDKLADICSRQADAASDAKVRADALQRLGLLYTEKVE